MGYEVTKTDEEWQASLAPGEFQVLRGAATERPWSGALLDEHRDGLFRCKACDAPLFKSTAKFDSGSGWPSFFEPVSEDAVELKSDRSWGMTRTEVRCARCGSHLGHLFDDAPQTPSGERYCMNSVSLSFEEQPEA
jgi:peptide-methionine (R)-S-oxide reductase